LIARALTLTCCLGLAGAAAPLPAATDASKASSAQKELRQLKSRIEAVRQRLADAEESKSEAADALQESERAISNASRALATLLGEAREANLRLAELKGETQRLESGLKTQQTAAAKMLYQQYTAGKPETLAILLNGRDPNAIARDLHYLTYIGRARSELIARMRENLASLGELTAEAERKAAELATITTEQVRQRRRLDQEKRARASVLARISQDIDNQRREIGTLKRDEGRLTQLIDQLAKVIARTPKPRPAPPQSRASADPRYSRAGT
jgi:septal ring factor EnvC (AmiA/AmiB activator)